jgi:pimeloyl-ACP methyl ester carboxylesterase
MVQSSTPPDDATVDAPLPKRPIEAPYYPIVYVRGYAMTPEEREQVFHDAYYGFSATSVEKRQAPKPVYFEADIFEGQLIRFLKEHDYVDATNRGFAAGERPERSIWISRFYDLDVFQEKTRSMLEHAEDLCRLILDEIPSQLGDRGVDCDNGYKVILIAHSMGGLVCRTLIQNILPAKGRAASSVIHRLVTMGTPHRGIDLGNIPDFLERGAMRTINPFDAAIFDEPTMREYLKLEEKDAEGEYIFDVHSLGRSDFPIERCLCVIGSDYQSYGLVRKVTGGFSDGLVKQDRAYVVSGSRADRTVARADNPEPDYPEARQAFYANVHRAHSGFRGIVNSYESYDNIQRFLFGNAIFRLSLDDLQLKLRQEAGFRYFYDIEFTFSIRNTGSYLHRRQQAPCENAIRVNVDDGGFPRALHLHTGFFNTDLRRENDDYSHFLLTFRLVQHRVSTGLIGRLFDQEYPERQLYNEALEARVGDPHLGAKMVQYRWLSDLDGAPDQASWRDAQFTGHDFRLTLRDANTIAGALVVQAATWPDPGAAALRRQ